MQEKKLTREDILRDDDDQIFIYEIAAHLLNRIEQLEARVKELEENDIIDGGNASS